MGLARRIVASLIGEPAAIPDELMNLFPELAGARYRVGGIITRIGGWPLGLRRVAAVTLWRTVFIAPGARPEPELLLHELRHVQQFQASATFPLRYVLEWLRRGYRENHFEVDARRWASARVRAVLSGASRGDE